MERAILPGSESCIICNPQSVIRNNRCAQPGTIRPLILLVSSLLLLLSGACHKSGAAHDKNKLPEQAALKFHQAQFTAGGKNVTLELARLAKVTSVVPVAFDQARRDTALHCFESMQSYLLKGQSEADLQAYADHFIDPERKFESLKVSIFERARKLNEIADVIGLIRYDKYTIVVSSPRRGHYTGTAMIQRSGKYYIDEEAGVTDPVLQQLSVEKYKILRDLHVQ